MTPTYIPFISQSLLYPASKSHIYPESLPFHAIWQAIDSSRTLPIQITHSGNIREIAVKKNGVKSVPRMCSGVCTIQSREKAIVESPTYNLAASADLSTSGLGAELRFQEPSFKDRKSVDPSKFQTSTFFYIFAMQIRD